MENGASVRVLGSDPRRAHGLAPVLVLADEGSQWPENVGERMVAALRTGGGKQPSSRFVALGTKPDSPDHWFARMIKGGADYSQDHSADPEDKPFQKRTWQKANPSLNHMPDLLDHIRAEAKDAKVDPSALASFRALRLNLGTADHNRPCLVTVEAWKAAEADVAPGGDMVLAVDLGSGTSMSAVAACWASGRLECMAAFPSEPGLAERGLRDGVGNQYVRLHATGDLVVMGAHVVPVGPLLEAAITRFGVYPTAILTDRWRYAELLDALTVAGLNIPILTRGQGFRDGGEDVRSFERGILSKRIRPVRSLLLRTAMSEAECDSDPAGNRKIRKRRSRSRDDAAVAACMAGAHVERTLNAPPAGMTWARM